MRADVTDGEGRLTDRVGKTWALKNGGRVDLDEGQVLFEVYQSMLHNDPRTFQDLLRVARGDTDVIPPESLARLKECGGVLRGDGIAPAARDVLLSAYLETPDGPAVVNPFRVETREQAAELVGREDEALRRLGRLLRRDTGDGEDRGRPPGRG
jgi:hypothetical protein